MTRLVVFLLVTALGQGIVPLRERVFEPEKAKNLRVRTPMDGAMLEFALARVSAAISSPFGLELRPEPRLPDRVIRQQAVERQSLEVGGMTFSKGMDALVALAPGYEWHDGLGVINVLPGDGEATTSFVQSRVDRFDVDGVIARRAIEMLHRQFDPEYPEGPARLPPTMSLLLGAHEDPQTMLASREELDQRIVSVTVVGGTVRDVLNQIVRSHGGASWIVDYSGDDRSYANTRIRLVLGTGTSSSTQIPFTSRARGRQP